MGRKKIQISRITDERNRQVTFNKRKFGVMKKAYELSVLCDCEIALIIFSSSNKLYQYASTDMDKVLLKYTEYNEPHESLTNKNIIEKEHKNGVMSPESPEPESEYQLTPRTEAKYSKIDEDFQMMLQRNQSINGQRMGSSNYSQPVSVPVNISYSDSGLLQSSPQMAHTSISPRPSSSETDSVYPSGGMLEMSNGNYMFSYPNSSSPIGGSPSPGPSPGPGMSSSKHQKQLSPSHRSNLRVVIPTPLGSSITTDEVSYAEHNRSQSALNTPVVALQTPGLGYPGALSSFGAQDFTIGSDMTLTSMPWSGHQMVSALAHSGGGSNSSAGCLPHLAVSSSTPPPTAGSPLPVKIKSEPISPPRDHHPHLSSTAVHHSQTHVQTLNLTHSGHHPRPSSAGHITHSPGNVTPTNLPSPTPPPGPSSQPDYDSSAVQLHKRPRLSDWPS
ncbi:myocyte-specific enhancer factor 2 isoform X1 [Dendroctonus ponderosae]|uniref:MADS-box domain-containing protein n=1 Tax=Dendroctonus ponderosae TaxID=77166 RepID=A0AAR5PVN5_DENPD|nr:myocyte-specific enhancer factor 2 isoform X1 [Dendroctonus ponderosae]